MPCSSPLVAFLLGLFCPGMGLIWTCQTYRGLRVLVYAGCFIGSCNLFDWGRFQWVPVLLFFTFSVYYAVEAAMLAARWRAGQEVEEDERAIWKTMVGRRLADDAKRV